jgi:uncharacterized protein
MRCSYCFYHARSQLKTIVLSDFLLEKFIKEYLDIFTGRICFNWHGGEPLLAGINFFKKIVEYEKKYSDGSQEIHNTVQTNGTLITKDWARFFHDNAFGVGVSLDGTMDMHDRFRKTVGQGSSFKKVLRGINLLRETGLDPAVIQTLSHSNSSADAIVKSFNFFFKELRICHLGLNFFCDIDGSNKEMDGESVSDEDFIRIMETYFECWLEFGNPNVCIREIENFISGVVGKRGTTCNWNGTCTGFFCLNADGTVYSFCDRMSNNENAIIGNINEHSLRDILNSKKRISCAALANKMPDQCYACKWVRSCHNGCALHRTESPQGKYVFCEARKHIFAYTEKRINQLTNQSQTITKEKDHEHALR